MVGLLFNLKYKINIYYSFNTYYITLNHIRRKKGVILMAFVSLQELVSFSPPNEVIALFQRHFGKMSPRDEFLNLLSDLEMNHWFEEFSKVL